jgi:hypothetical protein
MALLFLLFARRFFSYRWTAFKRNQFAALRHVAFPRDLVGMKPRLNSWAET